MTITIDLPDTLEQEVREAAALAGVAPDAYIATALRERLAQLQASASRPARLPLAESRLLTAINASLSGFDWARYNLLGARRRAEIIDEAELAELTALADALEAANVRRVAALAELARLRGVPLDALMLSLGIAPHG